MSRLQIGGALPFDNAGAKMFQGLSGTPEEALNNLGTSYANSYNNALAMNQALYDQTLKGYQDTMATQTSAQDAIRKGYSDLTNNVLGDLSNAEASRRQEINDAYAYQVGLQTQGLVNRGLGNTTVQNSVVRGLTYDQGKMANALADQFAQTRAGYRSQLGQAGLGFDERAANANTGLAQGQLNWMNSIDIPYPDAGAYGALAQQYGAMRGADADRAAQQDMQNRLMLQAMNAAARPRPANGGAVGAPVTPSGPSVSYGGGRGGQTAMPQAPSYGGGWAGGGFSGLGIGNGIAGAAPTFNPGIAASVGYAPEVNAAAGLAGGGLIGAAAAGGFNPQANPLAGLVGGAAFANPAAEGYNAIQNAADTFGGIFDSFWG